MRADSTFGGVIPCLFVVSISVQRKAHIGMENGAESRAGFTALIELFDTRMQYSRQKIYSFYTLSD